jgi:hypothetical protein
MDNSEKIKNCKTIISLITNGFIIDDKKVPGLSDLSDLSDIDNKMLYLAVAMFCANNNFVITEDGDIDIKPIMSGGGKDEELIKFIAATEYDVELATISVKPKNSKLMIYRFIYMLITILSLAAGLRVMFYLYENTFQEKMRIISNSRERLVTLVKNYPSEALILDYNHVLQLMNEYNTLTTETQQTNTDLVVRGFTENIYQQYDKLKYLKMTTQLQLEYIPELKNPETVSLDGLTAPIKGILNVYRYCMIYIFKLRESKLEELLYNNEIYQKVQTEYQKTREITEDMINQYDKFIKSIKTDTDQSHTKLNQPVIEILTDSLSGLVTDFFSSKSSTFDVTRAKYNLLEEIIKVWSRIIVDAPRETSEVMRFITIFFANISNIVGLIQEQIYISCAIYSFFQYILFLIYTKMIEKKITVNDFYQISEKVQPIVQESVNEYFTRHNLDKTDALIVLTNIFIKKMYEKIMNPESGLINYGKNVEETIETNKEDIRNYIINTIDKIVTKHSRDDILSIMFNIIFGQNNIFGEKELAHINKLLTIIYKEDYVTTQYVNNQSNRLQIKDSSGGKKRNKNRTKTNKRKINRKTRRLIKTSRMRKTKKNKKRKTKKK